MKPSNYNMNLPYGEPVETLLRNTVRGSLPATGALTRLPPNPFSIPKRVEPAFT